MNEFDIISFDVLENISYYSNSRDNYLYSDNDFTDNQELEEQEEQSEIDEEQAEVIDYSPILNVIYEVLTPKILPCIKNSFQKSISTNIVINGNNIKNIIYTISQCHSYFNS